MPSSPPAEAEDEEERPVRNGVQQPKHKTDAQEDESDGEDDDDAKAGNVGNGAGSDTAARLDAMQQERDSLRAEVTQLRKSLESLQEKHSEEKSNYDVSSLRQELEQAQQGKETAEANYRTLQNRVNTIRSQLGERLKADAAELEQRQEKIEELEASAKAAEEENQRLQEQLAALNAEKESQASEIESLRSRTSASTTNWARERDEYVTQEARLREEYENAKQAMQDWEILATEERSRREALEERSQELEDQVNSQREAYERIRSEAEMQSSTVDGLQRALREVQEERKKELREMVESNQAQLDALKAQTKAAEEKANDLEKQLEETKKELERTAPFEKEVKEKNLLIGKLRHEAVILNDHLTKALRFLKRGKPEDNVDRQLVTNHFLHFLHLDRSDPKKFQILQLIAALLGWDEQQKEQAGLLRQGTGMNAAGGSLRVPMSPFRRTPSTPTLGEFTPESPIGGRERESLAELWSEFLEREAEQGGSGHSRRPSLASNKSGMSNIRSPSIGGIMSPTSESGRGPFGKPPQSPELKRKESSAQASAAANAAMRPGSGGDSTK
ncbi:GRIP domain-containing protein [Pseudocercospora fuligena]|uniref:GRIP domain-containing protein n=1 Tax=Pseudocercospora fuligena TaxID=685502 RepID=A0A8H6RE67_9PEZI|nr:GRIP domain-containing protein [Pseudocercospora fuligena]